MKMVALNAAVQAARFGEEGLALGVLADYIQQLSRETSGHIESIGEDLRSIFESAAHLRDSAASLKRRSTEESMQMNAEMKEMIPSLQRLDEEAKSLMGRIEDEGSALSQDLQSSGGGLHFQGELFESIEALGAEIDAACSRMEPFFRKKSRSERSGALMLEGLEGKYTMQRERDVHHSILGAHSVHGDSPLTAPEGALREAADEKGEEEFDENVELF